MPDRSVIIPHKRGLNPYLDLLSEALGHHGWKVGYAYPPPVHRAAPVTWIHWPEQLTDYRDPSREDLDRLGGWLARSAREGIVVWTVHNLHRHGMPDHPGFQALYCLTALHAQVQLHHGEASVELARRAFPDARPRVVSIHPHGGYWNLVGTHTRASARHGLGLSPEARILLVFGSVRGIDDYRLVLQAARAQDWRLVVAGRLPRWHGRQRLRLWRERWRVRHRWTYYPGLFASPEVDSFLKAADALLIPRRRCLNSGNLYLSFTFGKPVVGPDLGVVGEVLRATGNPVFDPDRPSTLLRGLADLAFRDYRQLGERNVKWLRAHGQWEAAARSATQAIEEARRQNVDEFRWTPARR